MSAITGIYLLDGQQPDSTLVTRMTAALAHRGPDGCDTWQAGPVGLGHCMLRTTPESFHENLPLTNDEETLAITADARIDNREELISDLNLGQEQGILPDSSLILHAYQRWGENCVDHLLGDFAFAVWDAQKQELFCARDHMGVRPFYYARSDGCFAFASDMQAFSAVPGLPGEVREEEIVHYLASIEDGSQGTLYHRIFRLTAAHTLKVTLGGIQRSCYWQPDPQKEIHYTSDEEYERAFRQIFTDAVRCRMRSAFPVGFLLSGGLDSSSVVSVAGDIAQNAESNPGIAPPPMHTFSVVFLGIPACDESDYIRAVLAKGAFSAHFVTPGQHSTLTNIEEHQERSGDLLNDKNLLLFWQAYSTAQKTGVRTLIDGFFGDTAISYGGGCLADLARSMKWRTAITEAAAISRQRHIPFHKVLWQQVFLRLIPRQIRSRWRSIRKRPEHRPDSSRFIHPHLVRHYDLDSTLHDREKTEDTLKTARELHHFDLFWPARQRDFENLASAAAAFDLDVRHPFTDRRLVEFCLALPPEQKIRGGYNRAILRNSLASVLPGEIMTRAGKANLDIAFYSSMAEGTRDLEEILFQEPQLIAQYINTTALREAYDDFLRGDHTSAEFLWRAAYLARWLQRHASSIRTPGERRQ